MGPVRRRLALRGELSEMRTACDFVMDAAREMGLNSTQIYHCELCVEEVFTNIVEHGYQYNGSDKQIVIEVDGQPEKLLITFIDDAPSFNPLNNNYDEARDPLDHKSGGWGIYFVQLFMNRVSYCYTDKQNRLTLEKDLPHP